MLSIRRHNAQCLAPPASMLFYRICTRSAFHNEVSRFAWLRAIGRYAKDTYLYQDVLAAIGSFAVRSSLPWKKRHMHAIGSFALGRVPATVVAGRRRHA